jgi:hypothetical protein
MDRFFIRLISDGKEREVVATIAHDVSTMDLSEDDVE